MKVKDGENIPPASRIGQSWGEEGLMGGEEDFAAGQAAGSV